MMKRTKIVAGNWKMNLLPNEAFSLIDAILPNSNGNTKVVFGVPAPYLFEASAKCINSSAEVAAQNCHELDKGAFTGELSPALIQACSAKYVILGHSERRSIYGESDSLIAKKMVAAWRNSLIPILCVGETLEERNSGSLFEVISTQLSILKDFLPFTSPFVIAYEPVWAIGTGVTATPDQAVEMHKFIRTELNKLSPGSGDSVSILYGGSVKASNAAELFSFDDIDGGLVGGASLEAAEFNAIISAMENTF